MRLKCKHQTTFCGVVFGWGKASRVLVYRWITSKTFHDVQNSNRRCTGHATKSTQRANGRLITVHGPFLAILPNQNETLQFVLCTIDPQCSDDCCTLCGLVFWEKKGKRKIVWEFAKIFQTMVGVELIHVGTVFFGKIPWRTSPWIFHLWSVTQGFHAKIAKRFLVWPNSQERRVHCN